MADDCCDAEIDASRLEARQRRVLISVTLINVGTLAMMVVAARSSGSTALLSGALDNLGDALTYALSLLVVGAGLAAKARVALFKGILIAFAALIVAIQIDCASSTRRSRCWRRWASRPPQISRRTPVASGFSGRTATATSISHRLGSVRATTSPKVLPSCSRLLAFDCSRHAGPTS
jgi:hypothetical protein